MANQPLKLKCPVCGREVSAIPNGKKTARLRPHKDPLAPPAYCIGSKVSVML